MGGARSLGGDSPGRPMGHPWIAQPRSATQKFCSPGSSNRWPGRNKGWSPPPLGGSQGSLTGCLFLPAAMSLPMSLDAQQRGTPGELFARNSQARPRLRRSCRGRGLRWRRDAGNCGTQDRTPIDWASPRPAIIALGSGSCGSCIGLLSCRRRPLPRLPFLELFFLALQSVRAQTLVLALDGVTVAAAFRWVVAGQFDVE